MTSDTTGSIMDGKAVSQRRKRIEKILSRPTQMTFAEVEKILEDFGLQCVRTKGSHHFFRGGGVGPIVVPTVNGRWVATEYLDQICVHLGLDTIDLD